MDLKMEFLFEIANNVKVAVNYFCNNKVLTIPKYSNEISKLARSSPKSDFLIQILIQKDKTSAVAAINKMGSTRSIDMVHVVHLTWNFILKHDNCITATHIPSIFKEEADIESRKHETRTE